MSIQRAIYYYAQDLKRAGCLSVDGSLAGSGLRPAVVITPDQEMELMQGLKMMMPPYARDGILSLYGIRIFVRP